MLSRAGQWIQAASMQWTIFNYHSFSSGFMYVSEQDHSECSCASNEKTKCNRDSSRVTGNEDLGFCCNVGGRK